MQNRTHYWMAHLAAAKFEGLTLPAYAHKHGVGVSTLYRWQQRLKSANNQTGHETPNSATNITPAAIGKATPTPGKFVSLRVTADANANAAAANPSQPTNAEQNKVCTLSLPGGIDLHLHTLPQPTWLMALSRAAQERN